MVIVHQVHKTGLTRPHQCYPQEKPPADGQPPAPHGGRGWCDERSVDAAARLGADMMRLVFSAPHFGQGSVEVLQEERCNTSNVCGHVSQRYS